MNFPLLFVALVWGINFSAVKFALTDFHPLVFTVIRFAFAALFLIAVMLVNREPLSIERQDRFAIIRLGFIGITLYNIFFMYGLKYTSAANSALLISLSPLCGALISAALRRERLTLRAAAGLGLAAAGVILIIGRRNGAPGLAASGMAGDLLSLCATFTWAFYTISAKPLLAKYSALKVTAYNMAAGSILLLPVSLPGLAGQSWTGITGLSWLAAAFAAFIAAGVAYVFWYEGVKRLGVIRTMVYHNLMPFAAVLFAAIVLGEKITVPQVCGGISIIAGISLVQGTAGSSESMKLRS